VKEPEKFYEFDDPQNDPNLHAAQVQGPTQLAGKKVEVTDLRAGATLTIAALAAAGRSEIFNIEHIDRGYEDLDDKLGQLGAKIKRIR
jgi:UDP-N-acetylglucosamine 1-carboxyvinyltransferase